MRRLALEQWLEFVLPRVGLVNVKKIVVLELNFGAAIEIHCSFDGKKYQDDSFSQHFAIPDNMLQRPHAARMAALGAFVSGVSAYAQERGQL